jgi:DNA-binding transcriptional regulator GbsR (MarR family)
MGFTGEIRLAYGTPGRLFIQLNLNDLGRSEGVEGGPVASPTRSDRHEVQPELSLAEKTTESGELLCQTQKEFIETVGRVAQELGLPRSLGQIYGLLYLSPESLSLDDIAVQLSISKGSASTGTRQLAAWQAIQQVWIPGDRRDYFQAKGDIRELLEAVYKSYFKPKLEKGGRKLQSLGSTLEDERRQGGLSESQYQFFKTRLASIGRMESRIQQVLPIAEKLL